MRDLKGAVCGIIIVIKYATTFCPYIQKHHFIS